MIDEVVDVLSKLVSLLARVLGFLSDLASSIAFEATLWWLGWIPCRIWTLGHFPREGFLGFEKASTGTAGIVYLAGVVHLAVAIYGVYILC